MVPRLPGTVYAISDTGPLISAFQSASYVLLSQIFDAIHIPPACMVELNRHGWHDEVEAAKPHLDLVELTEQEQQQALNIAQQISGKPGMLNTEAKVHVGEAQAIVLALRPDYPNDVLLLDELAARQIAKEIGLNISGFPGVLLLAVQYKLISPGELKTKLEACRQRGTHYSAAFIEEVYEIARQG